MWSWNITSDGQNNWSFLIFFMMISDDFRLKVPKIAKKGT